MTTETSDPTETPTARQALDTAPKKGFFQRIVGALFAPAETFEDIARKPDVLAPLIFLILIGYASTIAIMPIMDWEAVVAQQADQMRARQPNLSDAEVDRMANMTRSMGQVMGYVGPILGAIWWLIIAGVMLIAFRLFGGEGNFKQAFSATLYSWMPLTILSIVTTIVARARGSFDPTQAATIVKSNPAFLIDMKEQPVLFSLLSSIDLFTIWTVVLLIFGFAALSRLSRAKAAAIVISLWIVTIVVKVGFAALGAGMAKG
jgi:hypothetical protein